MSLSRAALLHSLTARHEKVITSLYLGGEVLIREPSAHERLIALEAAQKEDSEQIDNTLYRALLIQMCVVDPATGVPYADGRIDPATQQPAIDPRTRAPLLTPDDVAALMDARENGVAVLVNEITGMARLLPADFPSSDSAADATERDAGTGVETGDADDSGDAG